MKLTLTEKWRQAAAAHEGRVALLVREDDSLQEYTYAQVYQDCLKVAHWLRRAGVKPGDRVALLLENRPEWCLAYFGLQLAGAVAVPLDAQSLPETVSYLLTQTQAKILITSNQLALSSCQDLPFLEKIVAVGLPEADGPKLAAWPDLLAAPRGDDTLPEAAPDDLAAIIYTSGTVGPPKGVMLTNRNFLTNFLGIAGLEMVGPQDNFLALLPLHHCFPFMGTLILPLFLGARVTFLNRLQAQLILRCIREQRVTILVATPQVLQHFAQGIQKGLDDLPLGLGRLLGLWLNFSWKLRPFLGFNPAGPVLGKFQNLLGPQFRYFVSGGAKLPVDLARLFNKWGFTVLEGYGLTETAPVVTFNPPEAPRLGSVGRPLAGVEVKIDQPDAEGVGEILIRGDNVMPGYYQNPEV
ncbi:MAG TPA: AMP-binding protein, partial [Desulfobaccales bacterium]|nr:AMP-binding protein [Desulfobaccales bacterium]